MILGASFEDEFEGIVINNITVSLCNYLVAKKISQVAKKNNKIVKIHIKIDTGMSRLGFVAGINDKEIIDEIIIEGHAHRNLADEVLANGFKRVEEAAAKLVAVYA